MVLVLLLLGGDRLSLLGKGVGASIKTFKKTLRERPSEPPPRRIIDVSGEALPPKEGDGARSGSGPNTSPEHEEGS